MSTNRIKEAHEEAKTIVEKYRMLGEDIYEYIDVLKHQIIQKKESSNPKDLEQAAYDEELLATVKKLWDEQ